MSEQNKVLKKHGKPIDAPGRDSRNRNRGASAERSPPGRRVDNCLILGTDPRGTITRINAYGAAFLGEDADAIVGKKFSQVVLPEKMEIDRRRRRLLDYFLHAPGSNDSAEFNTRHVSGQPRRIVWIRSAVRSSKGTVDGILCIGIDVHQDEFGKSDSIPPLKKKGETVCPGRGPCDSESNYSLLEKYIDNSKMWAWEMGPDACFCYVSPGIETLLGYTRGELIDASMDFLLSSESENGFLKVLEGALQNEPRQFKCERQCRCKDGKAVWIEITGVVFRSSSGAFAGARGMIRDITLEVTDRGELVLREQEHRYLFNNTQVALIMLNEEGIMLNINKTGAKICERTPEEMIGLKMTEFIPEHEREGAFEAFKKIYSKAKSQKSNFVDIEPYVTRLDTPKGTRYLRLVPKAIKVMDGDQMVAILNTGLDISESYVLQQALKQHQQQLQKLVDERTDKIRTLQAEMLRDERLMALGRLTSTVSHEIRNPLGTISSSLYIINERLKENDFGVGPAVERASRAVRRCDGIIKEMLDFTRPKVLERRIVDMSSWLVKLLEELVVPKNVSIVRRIDPGLSAQIDVVRFHRCLTNILENAMEALGGVDDGTIHMDARLELARIEINITDTGPGISRARRKNIFDPLYSTKTNGIGMGLSVCKQVMELHGGSIAIRSKTGMGTTVSLRLPALLKD